MSSDCRVLSNTICRDMRYCVLTVMYTVRLVVSTEGEEFTVGQRSVNYPC